MPGDFLIRDMDPSNKPRERLLEKGAESLSNIELVSIIIRTGGAGLSSMDLAARLLNEQQSLKDLFEADINQLAAHRYMGHTKAVTIKAVGELAKRAYLGGSNQAKTIKKPEDAYNIIRKDLFGKKQEHLYLISLDVRRNLVSKDLICIGSVNETLIPIREIIRKAIIKDAVNLILVHNHPSGDPAPSQEDIIVTEKVAKACQICGLALLDHIITADNNYISIKSLDLFEKEVRK